MFIYFLFQHDQQLHCMHPIGPFILLSLVRPSPRLSSKTSVSLCMVLQACFSTRNIPLFVSGTDF